MIVAKWNRNPSPRSISFDANEHDLENFLQS